MANENLIVFFILTAKRGKGDDLTNTWNRGVEWLKTRPGWVDERLAQSHDDPNVYVSIQEWTDADNFRNAVSNDKFQDVMNNLPVKEDITVASYSVLSKGARRLAA